MIPASKATLARTIPGPPRALVVIARLMTSSPRKPASLPASDTESTFQSRRDHSTPIDHKQPWLGLEVKCLQLRPQSLGRLVVHEHLFVDERDSPGEFMVSRFPVPGFFMRGFAVSGPLAD